MTAPVFLAFVQGFGLLYCFTAFHSFGGKGVYAWENVLL